MLKEIKKFGYEFYVEICADKSIDCIDKFRQAVVKSEASNGGKWGLYDNNEFIFTTEKQKKFDCDNEGFQITYHPNGVIIEKDYTVLYYESYNSPK